MSATSGRLAIIVGGGPAPGINAVISSATIEAVNSGFEVFGVQQGFKHLIREDVSKIRPLTIDDVSRIHLDGGSILGTARDNPTKAESSIRSVINTLRSFGITHVVTIGGDDTALSSRFVFEKSDGAIHTVHVPKTIDNDLPLPAHIPTFGFQTARHVGVELVRNLMEDARSTKRWYIVVAMGRQAGHLALGIGKASGATLTIIREEFDRDIVSFAEICDIVEGSIIKRRAMGKGYGVVLLSEALVERFDPAEIAELQDVDRDAQGNIRVTEIDLGRKVKSEVQGRLEERGVKVTVVDKTIGYELRCAPPIPMDAEYARDLGFAAVTYLLGGGSGAMITVQGGDFQPIPFGELIDPQSGGRRRVVDTSTESYQVARDYMVRIEKEDFADEAWTAKLADAARLSLADFKAKYAKLLS